MKELTDADEVATWFKGRTWSVSGDESHLATTSLAARVVFPTLTQVSNLINHILSKMN